MAYEGEEKQPKKKRPHILRWFLAVLLALAAFFGARQLLTIRDQKAELAALAQQIAQQQAHNADLQDQLDNAKTISNVERLAREKLNMIRDGEISYSEETP